MIRYPEIEPAVTAKAVVHAAKPAKPAVVHKRKPGLYRDHVARRSYKAEWMARKRASEAAR